MNTHIIPIEGYGMVRIPADATDAQAISLLAYIGMFHGCDVAGAILDNFPHVSDDEITAAIGVASEVCAENMNRTDTERIWLEFAAKVSKAIGPAESN